MSDAAQTAPDVDAEPTGVNDLAAIGEGLLRDARNQPSRRAARTIVAGTALRVTAIALLEGAELAEHSSPPTATLQAVAGTVRLRTSQDEQVLRPGELLRIPPRRHSLHADTDAVVLLTVALR